VYLLGATLHQILTGRFRHDAKRLEEALRSAFESVPVSYDDSVPQELAALCNGATSREPTDRPETALAFRQAIADFLRHKSSIALAEEATERLEQLRAVLEATPEDEPPDDLRSAHRLVSECRFGFAQALKEWNENESARAGMTATVVRAVELELCQGHVPAAEALMQELAEPPPVLRERLRRAQRLLARTNAEEERLRSMAREQDSSVAGRERSKGLAGLTGAAMALSVFALSQPNPDKIKPEGLLAFAGIVFGASLIVVLFWRKRMLQNQFSRRLTGLLLLSGALLILSRGLGVWLRIPAPLVLAQDLLIFASVTGVTAVLLLPWLAPLAAIMAGGAVYCLTEPSLSVVTFSVLGVLTPPGVALALWRHRVVEEQEREDAVPDSTWVE
jgi:serine/threonine-protein kinase